MLAEIGGLPLVMWAYRGAAGCGMFTRVIVATDDERIERAVRSHGGEAVMTRSDHECGTDRVREAAAYCGCDYVVNLQGDEPEVPADVLQTICGALGSIDDNSLLTCVADATIEERDDPNVVKAVLATDGNALYFSRAAIPFDRDGGGWTGLRHVGIYGFTRAGISRFCSLPRGRLERREMLEQLRALEAGMRIACVKVAYVGGGIDTPHDLDRFRRRVEAIRP
jgi:3-deoxy-manno-octulosonate cytidylyltransferase (CMP-KDO synthetase)